MPSAPLTLRLIVTYLLLATGAQAQTAGGPPAVTVAKPIVKPVEEVDEYTGRFDAIDTVDIRPRVTGFIDRVAFKDGVIVEKGDLLFVIDKRPYVLQVEQDQAALSTAKTQLEFATLDFDRAEALRKTGNITDQAFDQRRQVFNVAKAAVDRVQSALRRSELDLEFTEVRAPLRGRIGRRLVSEGNLVEANQTLLASIVSLDPIQFYFDVDERSYLDYQRNARISDQGSTGAVPFAVKIALSNEKTATHSGRLDFVNNRVDQASGTIQARAIIANSNFLITPGLFGRIEIPGSPRYSAVLVPDEAIANDQDRKIVYTVAEDGTVGARPVRIGPRIDGYRVVRDGLTGDETLIIAGLQRARPGAKVSPQMTTLPSAR